jgi:hypothetical protein
VTERIDALVRRAVETEAIPGAIVFLTNREPWKCHIHTLVRTRNGNDHGKDLLRQHYERAHPGRLPGGRTVSKGSA